MPLDKLREIFSFYPPTEKRHTTVEFLEAVGGDSAKGFLGLGGNLVRSA